MTDHTAGEGPAGELDLLVLGSGVAGLSAAVRAAEVHRMRVGVLTKGELEQSTTRWAQGGVAAVLTGDEDSTDLHLADTLAAGAGLCDADAVRVLVDEGPGSVNGLIALGAVFDRDADGRLLLAREGGHSLPRIVHAGGAATGAEIERALVDAVQHEAMVVLEHWFALDLLVDDDGGRRRCAGVVALDSNGQRREVRARNVLLATGGAGQLFAVTTNPVESTGDGVAMALRAGVACADVEFVQFHPTALHHPRMPRPLLSEALRGHGALLRDAKGDRFVDELLPRDEVSRAMTARMLEQDVEHLWLDATDLERFSERFPTITAALTDAGLDPASDWLPIAPAAHYLCGGVLTDLDGATSLPGLWAAGEVACSGVHGANRLASNSLLEGMVFAHRVVEAVHHAKPAAEGSGAYRAATDREHGTVVEVDLPVRAPAHGSVRAPAHGAVRAPAPGSVRDPEPAPEPAALRDRLQRAMTAGAGVLRSAASLDDAATATSEVAAALAGARDDVTVLELRNLGDVGTALLAAARWREESRGAHTRSDFPGPRAPFHRRAVVVARSGTEPSTTG